MALSRKGVKSCYMSSDQDNEDEKAGIIKGEYQVVYFTPEKIITGKRWREMLVGEVYSRHLKTFFINKAHTVKKWLVVFVNFC